MKSFLDYFDAVSFSIPLSFKEEEEAIKEILRAIEVRDYQIRYLEERGFSLSVQYEKDKDRPFSIRLVWKPGHAILWMDKEDISKVKREKTRRHILDNLDDLIEWVLEKRMNNGKQ